ncbi:hypothetical protein MGU_10388 [Metarhizium guizhouense ARSEF 977]|uniref:Uncharacterized protein n=1 Tax=Metarhizium guizhouense (strain ARSEF 977) TaxID=1276136 RepID=A0A0B4HS14_METGA|nr:hypothetical protein MGU_10388 [Metarhizium guizhouense ARSEF 977]
MFAAIILERVGAPLADGPFYSVMRALNGSPSSLLLTPSLRLRGTGLSTAISALIVLEVSVTTAVQFLSTLLVADFSNGAFTDRSIATNVLILNGFPMQPGTAWWSMPPAASWTFADIWSTRRPNRRLSVGQGTTIQGTRIAPSCPTPRRRSGHHCARSGARSPSWISESPVCTVQPALRDLGLDVQDISYARLSGQISVAIGTYPMLRATESQPYVRFTCALPSVMFVAETQGLTSLCWPRDGVGWNVLLQDPLVSPTPGTQDQTGYPAASTMYMLLDLVAPAAISPVDMVGNGTDAPVLRVTACMANLGVDTFVADLHSNWDGLEPITSWKPSAERYNTTTARAQLSAVLPRPRLDRRGVLALGPRSDWQHFFPQTYELPSNVSSNASTIVPPPGGVWTFAQALAYSLHNPQSSDRNPVHGNQTADRGVILSRHVHTMHFNAHESHTSLFQDTLDQTQSPAVALQALLTRICQMVYYEALPRLNESGHAETAFSHVAVLPTRWTGFGVGMGLLLTHWVVVLVVGGLSARYTRHSLLRNYWQAVSHMYSNETVAVLEEAHRINDRDVKRWVDAKGLGGGLFTIDLVRNKGKERLALTAKYSA